MNQQPRKTVGFGQDLACLKFNGRELGVPLTLAACGSDARTLSLWCLSAQTRITNSTSSKHVLQNCLQNQPTDTDERRTSISSICKEEASPTETPAQLGWVPGTQVPLELIAEDCLTRTLKQSTNMCASPTEGFVEVPLLVLK
eukprot:4899275-Amphidinium_carterae.1